MEYHEPAWEAALGSALDFIVFNLNRMFKTSNSQYGEQWVSVNEKADRNPVVHSDVPHYDEMGQRQAVLTHTLRTYKH